MMFCNECTTAIEQLPDEPMSLYNFFKFSVSQLELLSGFAKLEHQALKRRVIVNLITSEVH